MEIKEHLQNRFNKPENKGDEFGFTNQYKQNNKRIINKDGSFNVIRVGEKKSLFHNLITTSWIKFILFVFAVYILINVFFASVYLIVDYDGIGMTADYEVKNRFLIASFFSAQTYSGTGIGLALCKKIIENHQGIIFATAGPHEGSTFTIILPE